MLSYDFITFSAFAKEHPTLLFPALTMQGLLCSTIVGNRFWRRIASRRHSSKEVLSIRKLKCMATQCKRSRGFIKSEHSVSESRIVSKRGHSDTDYSSETTHSSSTSPMSSCYEDSDFRLTIKPVMQCAEGSSSIRSRNSKRVAPLV